MPMKHLIKGHIGRISMDKLWAIARQGPLGAFSVCPKGRVV